MPVQIELDTGSYADIDAFETRALRGQNTT